MSLEQKIEDIKVINTIVDRDLSLIPDILKLCADKMEAFKAHAKRQNDFLLREALGDAVHILGMKKRPPTEEVRRLSLRIEKAIFKQGIQSYHHQGEKNFYLRYLANVITQPGTDRRYQWCQCAVCKEIHECTPSFDFYEVKSDKGTFLYCEKCFKQYIDRIKKDEK